MADIGGNRGNRRERFREGHRKKRVEYDVIKVETVNFGVNKFVEIARKVPKNEDGTAGQEFISVSKGYYLPNGEKKYKEGLGFPSDERIAGEVLEKLKSIIMK
ncbi:MAG: hypothetical protein ACK4YO_02480 [Candidatus Altarchaeaceae archaeon]